LEPLQVSYSLVECVAVSCPHGTVLTLNYRGGRERRKVSKVAPPGLGTHIWIKHGRKRMRRARGDFTESTEFNIGCGSYDRIAEGPPAD